MPPKVKISKNDIIETAMDLLRKKGQEAINARNVALELDCSTQPIFSNFATMDDLQQAIISNAYVHYLNFIQKELESGEYPKYKSYGMAYIRFAKEEKELFKLLFMRDRNGEDLSPTPDFEASIEMIMSANNISREKAWLIHLEMWLCVHGIATMLVTSFLPLEWNLISDMVTDIYQGVRTRHLLEERK